jgi:ornithine cyclodeaminase/alanine dehydrogenase-like protein (mu-crystallin family)
MTGTVLQLRSHEVWSALEGLDPVATMAEYLISRTVGRAGYGRSSPGRLISWNGTGRNGSELVLLDHPDATGPCVVPAQSLRSSQAAALAAVAARELLVAGGVTIAMLGPAGDAQPQLSVLSRHVPDISHVALCSASMGTSEVEPKLADQLELSGIGVSVVPTVDEAVFGANLVIATNPTASGQDVADLRIGKLARGAVLINATGRDLPIELVDQVDQVYVDDLGLLEHYPDRHVVATHQAEPSVSAATMRHGAGPRIAGDLAQLLTGRLPSNRRTSDVVLVELLGAHELNADLAYRIYEVASHTGLGVRIAN